MLLPKWVEATLHFPFHFSSPPDRFLSTTLGSKETKRIPFFLYCLLIWGYWGTFSGLLVSSGNKIGVIFFLLPFRDHDIWFPCLSAADFFSGIYFPWFCCLWEEGRIYEPIYSISFSVCVLSSFAMMLTGDFSTNKKTRSVDIFATPLPFPPFLPELIL